MDAGHEDDKDGTDRTNKKIDDGGQSNKYDCKEDKCKNVIDNDDKDEIDSI